MSGNKLALASLLAEGVQPGRTVPKSDNLDRAIAAATRLNVIEMTYLIGLLNAELETYRASLVDATLNRNANGDNQS